MAALAQERRTLLRSNGFSDDYLEPHYFCPLCQDTGYVDGQKCSCFKKSEVELLYTQSNLKEILKKENFDKFIEQIKNLSLSQEELDKLKEQREREIDASLVKLNNDIYQNEKGLGENDRVYLVAASIIATLGIAGKVAPLEKSDLKSSTEIGNRDGDIIVRKIEAFLAEKQLPREKKDLIVRTLQNTLTTENINKVENGESQLKRVFTKIVDDLGIYYKIGLTTDFTGKLFNEMY